MYQSYASAEKDVKDAAVAQLARKGPTFLYVEVDNLEATIAALEGAQVIVPVRTTFYGATEISRPRMQVLRPDALVPRRNVTMQIS